MYRPKTRQDLWLAVRHGFGLTLPHKVFTPGHSTPFDFVADAFFNPSKHIAAWANRSGLKTLSASIIAALEFRFSELEVLARVLSGSEDQANNLYRYWANWCHDVLGGGLDNSDNLLIGEPGKQLTKLKNGEFQILAASQKRVRGGKVQRLFRDEVDEIHPEIWGASVGMLATRDDCPARTIDTSTWHYAHGPMGVLVSEADKRGITVHKWNIWESLANCPVERHDKGRNCDSCELGKVCLAKRREYGKGDPRIGIAADCCGLMAIADAITFRQQWSQGQWESEGECKRPSIEGLVYPEFDRTKHVVRDLDYDDDLPTYRAIDWGLRTFVCQWIQVTKHGRVCVVDEYVANDGTVKQHAEYINQKDKGFHIEATYCDPAGRNKNDQTGHSDIDIFRSMGIPCTYTMAPWAREVRNGINLIRGYLQPAQGMTRFAIAPACKETIKAFESYQNRKVNGIYIDEPIKPQDCDHAMDSFRYFMVNRLSPSRTVVKTMGYT